MSTAAGGGDARGFVLRELPARMEAVRAAALRAGGAEAEALERALGSVEVAVRWDVLGPGGGAFVIRAAHGRVEAREAAAEEPEARVALVQRAEDVARLAAWVERAEALARAAAAPEAAAGWLARAPALAERAARGLAALDALQGSVALELTGEEGFTGVLRFGEAARTAPGPGSPATGGAEDAPGGPGLPPADATVRVAPEALVGLATGATDPTQAFLSGAVAVEGDVGLALQLALAWMPPA